jgi:hypothetical protein
MAHGHAAILYCTDEMPRSNVGAKKTAQAVKWAITYRLSLGIKKKGWCYQALKRHRRVVNDINYMMPASLYLTASSL